MPTNLVASACCAALVLVAGAAAAADPSFRAEVAPLLEARCLACHSGPEPKAELSLATREQLLKGGASGKVVEPGRAGASLLYEHIKDHVMPPKEPLADREIDLVRRWIDSGLSWDGPALHAPAAGPDRPRAGRDWWSLQPVRRPVEPAVQSAAWIRSPIDAFILARLEAQKLAPAAAADRRTYIRRVTLDLTGLPPSPEEVDAFLADDSAQAYERLVDRLLASPHYGERWARHWLDVVRFAESHGYETNKLRRDAWPYRDYVIRAWNEDRPFAQFVLEQLAGDTLGDNDPLLSAATGFLVGGTHDNVGNATPEGRAQQRQDDLYDMVSTTGAAFLGLTVNCARCHDHKFDPILQRDYYALTAVFSGVQHNSRPIFSANRPEVGAEIARLETERHDMAKRIRELETAGAVAGTADPRANTEKFSPTAARFVRFTVLATVFGEQPCIDELEVWTAGSPGENVALASRGAKAAASSVLPRHEKHKIEHLNDGRLGNSYSWISNEPGRGWAMIELADQAVIDRVVWGRDREGVYRDRLARDYRIEISLDGHEWQTVVDSRDKQPPAAAGPDGGPARPADPKELARLITARKATDDKLQRLRDEISSYCGTFAAPDKTYLLKRGDPMQPQDEVGPAAIAAIGPSLEIDPAAPEPERRVALAKWIADPANPLPPRVLVNRLWHYHFGRGIVGTPSDFGLNGDPASHPELLDWLAAEFLAGGGRVKPLQRLIVLSAVYRQASQPAPDAAERARAVDADNRLLWHFPRRRVEAEVLRDSVLSVSGNLDLRMGGPGYDLWDMSNYVLVFKPKSELAPDGYRRMIYQFKPRTQQDPTFGAFDCPDATMTAPRRNVSTTAIQSLNLWNSGFMLDQAARFAERVRAEAGDAAEAQATRAFRLALLREPTTDERAAAVQLIEAHTLEALCRTLLNANEFVFVD